MVETSCGNVVHSSLAIEATLNTFRHIYKALLLVATTFVSRSKLNAERRCIYDTDNLGR